MKSGTSLNEEEIVSDGITKANPWEDQETVPGLNTVLD